MRLNSLSTLLFVGTVILAGCGGGGATSTDPITPETETEIDVDVTITDQYPYQVESLGTANTINAFVSIEGAPKSLYLVLSNNSVNEAGSATITHIPKVAAAAQAKAILPTNMVKKPVILHSPKYIQDFSSKISTLLSKAKVSQSQAKIIAVPERLEDSVDDTNSFCTKINLYTGNCTENTPATAKYVSTINTAFEDKTLNIWVSNDSFEGNCTGTCVTQEMVNALAETFLLSGSTSNDIYDWVTNIYGEEWGIDAQTKYSTLIGESNEITILLTDIDNDNSANGGVV